MQIVVGVSKSAGKYPAIVRNELSEWQTANLVAFNGEERLIGENALGRVRLLISSFGGKLVSYHLVGLGGSSSSHLRDLACAWSRL